jgi:hypothetical protein
MAVGFSLVPAPLVCTLIFNFFLWQKEISNSHSLTQARRARRKDSNPGFGFGCSSASNWLLGVLTWSFLSVPPCLRERMAVWLFGCLAVWLFGCSSASPRSPREKWLLVFSLVLASLDWGQ